MAKNLIVIRHAKRANKQTEELAPEYIEYAKILGSNLENSFGKIDVVIPSDYERTQNTARAMGYDFTICSPKLSASYNSIINPSKLGEEFENWKAIPWRMDFKQIRESYLQGGATKELGDYHANTYKWLIQNIKGDNILAITHDTRTEAATVSLIDKDEPLLLDKGLDYLDGIIFQVNQDKLYSAQTIRKNQKKGLVQRGRVQMLG